MKSSTGFTCTVICALLSGPLITQAADCEGIPHYVIKEYEENDVVQNEDLEGVDRVYSCKVPGWCSSDALWAYEPGRGSAYQQAWDDVGRCVSEDNLPPEVHMRNVEHFVREGDEVRLGAFASDPDGVVSFVKFYVNDELVSTDYNGPYDMPWVAKKGTHQLYATATDDKGDTQQSNGVSLVVRGKNFNRPPIINLIEPKFDYVIRGRDMQVIVQAYDPDGEIRKTQFFFGEKGKHNRFYLKRNSQGPFVSSLHIDHEKRAYDLWIKVTDNEGKSSVYRKRIGVRGPLFNIPPMIKIEQPDMQDYYLEDELPIQVQTEDKDGYVSKVRYYLNGMLLGESNQSPFDYSLELDQTGIYELYVESIDDENGYDRSEVKHFQVHEFPYLQVIED